MSEEYTIEQFEEDILHLCQRAANSDICLADMQRVLTEFAADIAGQRGMNRADYIQDVAMVAEGTDWKEKHEEELLIKRDFY